jgi:DNA excision repair protein ERCC-2
LAIKPVFDRFSSVVITSGTLSPLNFYPKILNFRPTVCESFEMSISRNCICPIVVTKGSDQVPISSKYDSRLQDPVVNNYGRLLIELSKNVPDGLICFFTSYIYMEEVVSRWQEKGILQSILQHKLIFVETKDVVETSLALDSYKKACDRGRGAIFLSVSRGKIAEGIDFDRHYGRCVVLMGVPFQYTLGRVLRARLHYLSEKFEIGEGEFLTFDAIRQASQCLGRVIRSKTDYGLMIFADHRYSRADKRKKLPVWITQFLNVENWSMSTEGAIRVARTFLREMAQPHNMLDSLGSTMLTLKQATALNNKMLNATAVTGEVVEQKMAMQARVERELAEDEIDMTLKMDM